MQSLIELMQRNLLESQCEGAADQARQAGEELRRAQYNIKAAEAQLRSARQDVAPHMGGTNLPLGDLGRAAYHLEEAFTLLNNFTARIHPEPAPAIDVPSEPSSEPNLKSEISNG